MARQSGTRASSRQNITAKAVQNEIRGLADPAIAQHSKRFFKTGPEDYGEGDQFLGVRVPAVRQLLRRFQDLPLTALEPLKRLPEAERRSWLARPSK